MVRLLLLWLLLELVGAAQVLQPAGGSLLGAWVRAVGAPVLTVATRVSGALDGAVEAVSGASRLAAENRLLRSQLELARARLRLLDDDLEAAREATAIETLAGSGEGRPLVGRVAYRDAAAGRLELRLAEGRAVAADTPALAAGGVLGRVVRADRRRCWVELLTHPASAVAVRSEGGEFDGLAVGGAGDELLVEFVPRVAEVLRGDLLVTSGADGVYPPGLPVARVTTVEESDAAFLQVHAEPAADPLAARVALLLVEWPAGDPEAGP